MSFPSDVIARKREWRLLREFAQRSRPGFALVLGRRRSGKSFLLTRLAAACGGIYYQATRQTKREQLVTLSGVLAERFSDSTLAIAPLRSWQQLLTYLTEATRAAGKPLLFVLDEFTYLSAASAALPSLLQRWIDHEVGDTPVRVVLCGSHVTAMRQLVDADQPLYGRREMRLEIRPFDYREAASFVSGWSVADRLRAFASYGGLPGNLSLLDSQISLRQNVAGNVLEETGRLFDEAAHVFDAYQSDAAAHYAILEAIAQGNRKWSKIANQVGKQTSALQRPLNWLIETGVVERTAPLSASGKVNPKAVQYHIADPYLSFWYRFVVNLLRRGLPSLQSGECLYDAYVVDRLDADQTVGVFEDACRTYVGAYGRARLNFDPVQVGRWWSVTNDVELDVVAIDENGGLLVGECKWSSIDRYDVRRLRQRADSLTEMLPGIVGEPQLVMFRGAGSQDERVADHDVPIVELEELYGVLE